MFKRIILMLSLCCNVAFASSFDNQQHLKQRLGEAANNKDHKDFMDIFISAKKEGIEENILREAARRAFTESIYQSMTQQSSEPIVSFFQNLGVNDSVVSNLKEKIEIQQAVVSEAAPIIEEIVGDNYGGDIDLSNLNSESIGDIIQDDADLGNSKIMRGAAVLVSIASVATIAYLFDQNWNDGNTYRYLYNILNRPEIQNMRNKVVDLKMGFPS